MNLDADPVGQFDRFVQLAHHQLLQQRNLQERRDVVENDTGLAAVSGEHHDHGALARGALNHNQSYDRTQCTGQGIPNPCCQGVGTGNCDANGNTAVGSAALLANTTGSYNIAVGYNALSANTTGTNTLMQLRPVRFRYKPEIDSSGLEQYGLVAEEVAKVYPDLVVYDAEGQPQTVRYHFVNAMLLNEVQKQARQIAQLTEQTRQVAEQAREMAQLNKETIDTLTARVAQLETVAEKMLWRGRDRSP